MSAKTLDNDRDATDTTDNYVNNNIWYLQTAPCRYGRMQQELLHIWHLWSKNINIYFDENNNRKYNNVLLTFHLAPFSQKPKIANILSNLCKVQQARETKLKSWVRWCKHTYVTCNFKSYKL